MSVPQRVKDEIKAAKENTCCKCGAKDNPGGFFIFGHKLEYKSIADVIEKTCYKCGYKWDVEPINPRKFKDET